MFWKNPINLLNNGGGLKLHYLCIEVITRTDRNKQTRLLSWSCGVKCIFWDTQNGGHTDSQTDRQTDRQTHRGVFRFAPQLKTLILL